MKSPILLLIFLGSVVFSQTTESFEENLELAFQNAKKGVYWALDNIPRDKKKLDNDLIHDDKLIARIDLFKEVGGVRVVSIGYDGTNSVTIEVYRSYDSLEKDKG